MAILWIFLCLIGIPYLVDARSDPAQYLNSDIENIPEEADTATLDSSNLYMNFIKTRFVEDETHTGPADAQTNQHACSVVTAVPSSVRSHYRLSGFYQKYTHAYNIPVLGSARVSNEALQRACYVLRFSLADHSYVRAAFYRKNGRVMIMASTEVTTDVPEHRWLGPSWNSRARGLGATAAIPLSSGAEENVLCYRNDRYRSEDIFLHELAHGVHHIGATFGIADFDQQLRAAYSQARARGLWTNTYAGSNYIEYFAEGVQSYFNTNVHRARPDGVHNHVSTREVLRSYDPRLFAIVQRVFPCANDYIKRCGATRQAETSQVLRMNCNLHGPGTTTTVRPPVGCVDSRTECRGWAARGECVRNPEWMSNNCKVSCGTCTGGRSTSPTTSTTTTTTTTTTPTTTAAPSGCVDKNNMCRSWANIGECRRNPGYMHINCILSCDLCPTTTTSTTTTARSCSDSHVHCRSWASRGECENNPLYMLVMCKRSCNRCTNSDDFCTDVNPKCSDWATSGYCETSPVYMEQNCRQSCNAC